MHSDIVRGLAEEYRARYELAPLEILDLATPSEIWRNERFEDGPGCYAIYDSKKMLRYVGASNSIKRRSSSHFARAVQACKFWGQRNAHFVQLIKTREVWEPWSLEIFLTKKTEGLRSETAP